MSDQTLGSEQGAPSLLALINGYRVTQAIHAVVVLGIPDLLADGPRKCDDLAAATSSHPHALYRLLRALAAIRILHEGEDGRFALTPLGEGLRSTGSGSLNAWARLVASPAVWTAWGDLLHAVRTGENAFSHSHARDVWTYRREHPEEGALFIRAMREGSARAATELLAAYDFSRSRYIVDVGGGDGALLARILTRCQEARGALFELPHVAEGSAIARSRDLASRCDVISGSFFDGVPGGGDLYLLKHVMHDWQDQQAVRILRACSAAMSPSSRLLIVERCLAPRNEGVEAKLSDLNMLVVTGGMERTRADFAALLAHVDLIVSSEIALPSGNVVFEATCGTTSGEDTELPHHDGAG